MNAGRQAGGVNGNDDGQASAPSDQPIAPLQPRDARGHQFVVYGDSCSGIAGAPHEATSAAVNAVVARLRPRPAFVAFLGDEIAGLTTDAEALRAQWRHWLDGEMAWLDRRTTPLYHTTGNHTTFDRSSEAIFREVLRLPANGPPGQVGLSYAVRRDDLLLVFVNTCWSGLGEGRVETEWLAATLAQHSDARHRLVCGHHPVFPVNGFSGPYQRDLEAASGRRFWRLLVEHGVAAYFCSHILAFDVQVHDGVLQVLTAGAGTKHRMPEGIEYLHALQVALDDAGLRYQVLDERGHCREWLAWPPRLPPADTWTSLAPGISPAPALEAVREPMVGAPAPVFAWRFAGVCPAEGGEAQTLLSAWEPGPALASLWIGLQGPECRLTVLLSPEPGRSPHLWSGPGLEPDRPFDLQVAIHVGMGPGGVLWRANDAAPWSSLAAASPWGAERLRPSSHWSVGHDKRGGADKPFRGQGLSGAWHAGVEELGYG